jgi:hypothetical protein
MGLQSGRRNFARLTHWLAVTPERPADRDELSAPGFLGDSVRCEQDDTLLSKDGTKPG